MQKFENNSTMIIYLILITALGLLVSTQPAVNVRMANKLNSPLLATLVSLFVSCFIIAIVWSLFQGTKTDWTKLTTLSWWMVIGGISGACFVLSAILIAPKTGLVMFFICIIWGQMIGSAILDNTGAFGMARHPITWLRIIGISFVIAGIFLTKSEG